MEPKEVERYDRVDRETPVTPSPDPAVRPAESASEEHYVRSTVVRGYDPRIERAIWFVVAVITSLIAIRFFMKLFGASYQADFVRFIYGVTAPLIGPFRGIFQSSGSGNNILEPESLIAIAIYLLIGWAIVALVRIVNTPKSRTAV